MALPHPALDRHGWGAPPPLPTPITAHGNRLQAFGQSLPHRPGRGQAMNKGPG